jgi:hypothetical protein
MLLQISLVWPNFDVLSDPIKNEPTAQVNLYRISVAKSFQTIDVTAAAIYLSKFWTPLCLPNSVQTHDNVKFVSCAEMESVGEVFKCTEANLLKTRDEQGADTTQ